jgi:hypothetical protein
MTVAVKVTVSLDLNSDSAIGVEQVGAFSECYAKFQMQLSLGEPVT